MKKLLKVLVVALVAQIISQNCFAEALVRVVTSNQLQVEKIALKSTFEDGKYIFERCAIKTTVTVQGISSQSNSNIINCKILGDSKKVIQKLKF